MFHFILTLLVLAAMICIVPGALFLEAGTTVVKKANEESGTGVLVTFILVVLFSIGLVWLAIYHS